MSLLVTNAFILMDTHGIPLSIIIIGARKRGGGVSIPHFFRDALRAGWKSTTALSRINEAMLDAGCDPIYAKAALRWLELHRELPDDVNGEMVPTWDTQG